MISGEYGSALLMTAVAFGFLAGLCVLTWGRRLSRKGDWLVWIALALLLTVIGVNLAELSQLNPPVLTYMKGWIGRPGERGALTLGVLQDLAGHSISLLVIAISGVFMSQRKFFSAQPRAERLYAAVAISSAGAVLTWFALTPWLALMGLTATLLGGFFALGVHWESEAGSSAGIRFAFERAGGLILAVVGAAGLAASRGGLNWAEESGWVSASALPGVDLLSGAIFLIGLLIQFQSFPFIGGFLPETPISAPIRLILAQLLPATAAFAILVRTEPFFRSSGLLPAVGWFSLLSATMGIGSGLFQKRWNSAFSIWASAGFSLASSVLAFSGPLDGAALFIGLSLGVAVVAVSQSGARNAGEEVGRGQKTAASKIAAMTGAALSTGVPGFVSAGAAVSWFAGAWTDFPALALFILVFFLFVSLAWRLASNAPFAPPYESARTWFRTAPFVLALLGLGILWSGKVTGGALPGDYDLLTASFLERMNFARGKTPDEEIFGSAVLAYWLVLALGIVLGAWLGIREQDETKTPAKTPGDRGFAGQLSRFIGQGYEIDRAAAAILRGIVAWVGFVEKWIGIRLWSAWLPQSLALSVAVVSRTVQRFDQQLSSALRNVVSKTVEVPAKGLQLLQNGDVQWYLVFAIGCGITILLHFMRV